LRRRLTVAPIALLFPGVIVGQQATAPASASNSQLVATVVSYAGPGLVAPQPPDLNFSDLATGECKTLSGTAELSAIVDATGIARNVYFLRPIGNDLDGMAVKLVTKERFKPGTLNGAPVAVAVTLNIGLQACIEEKEDDQGQKGNFLRIKSVPQQKLDVHSSPPFSKTATSIVDLSPPSGTPLSIGAKGSGHVNRPQLIHQVEARYTEYARENHLEGVCLIALIVDEHGLPQEIQVVQSLEPDLDQNAMYALSQYRFTPAMKKGRPVPVKITVEVNFRLQ
jgi:TonB family protein